MSLEECKDCGRDVSDKALSCPGCGRPSEAMEAKASETSSAWKAVEKVRTPINVFAFAMMACAAVFGFSATRISEDALSAFTYSLHTFLAIAGMFFVCLLFCRRAIYHPDDLTAAKEKGVELGEDRPVLAAILIGIMLLAYGIYQGLIEFL